jgi:low affinity Fe/Cu permease
MAVHRVSLFTALVLLLLAFLVAALIGPIAFLLLVAVGILIWYALGPGSGRSVTIITP